MSLNPSQVQDLSSYFLPLFAQSQALSAEVRRSINPLPTSPDLLSHTLTDISALSESTLSTLSVVEKYFKDHPSAKSPFLSTYYSKLKTYQNLDLFKEIHQKLSQTSQETGLLSQDLTSEIEALGLNIQKISAFEYLIEDYPDFMTVFLSVFNSLIYVTNFYILTLNAKDFSVYVGMDEGYSGLLSAANWASAVTFTFVYSYWSNFQYKIPTFVCALFIVIGDFTYFLAYLLKSPALMMIGRLVIGFGGARVINRRYIATFVHPRARTAWNSAFVAGSIIGRGLGPFLTALLLDVNFKIFSVEINSFTSPPLIMGSIWLIYAAAVLFFFKEPEIPKKSEKKITEKSNYTLLFVVILALVVPKTVHEAFVTSVPIFASDSFNWSDKYIGNYIAVMSLAIAPIHILIAYSSAYIEDRTYIIFALILTFFGSLLLVNFINSELQYIIGTVLMFIGMNLDDGVTASLLSKILPLHLSQGIFNAGLIVTLAGSSARGLGGFSIAVASWIDFSLLENLLFIPLTIISLVSILVFSVFYRLLKV